MCLFSCDSGSQESKQSSFSVQTEDVEVIVVSAAACADITLAGPIQARLEQRGGDEQAQSRQGQITISAPASERQLIEVDAEPSLHVQHKGESQIHITISCPGFSNVQVMGAVAAVFESPAPVSLERIAAYGTSKFAGPDVHSVALEVRAAGRASINLGAIDVDEVSLLVSGQAQIDLSGLASQGRLEMTGQSVVSARQLRCQWLEVQGRGTSQASIQASAHLGGKLSGSSKIELDGMPDINLVVEEEAQLIQ